MAVAWPLCYHGTITKQQCEEILDQENMDGAFLIRDSETIKGNLCLCVYKQRVVYTYRLHLTFNGYYVMQSSQDVEEKFFKTLQDLIHHFRTRDRGLAMHLRYAVKCKTPSLIPPPCPRAAKDESHYANVGDSACYVVFMPSSCSEDRPINGT